MVLPFRRKGSGKDDDEPVDQDIEDIMNEAEGLSEEEEPVVQEPVEEETGDELDLKEKRPKAPGPSLTPAWTSAGVKTF